LGSNSDELLDDQLNAARFVVDQVHARHPAAPNPAQNAVSTVNPIAREQCHSGSVPSGSSLCKSVHFGTPRAALNPQKLLTLFPGAVLASSLLPLPSKDGGRKMKNRTWIALSVALFGCAGATTEAPLTTAELKSEAADQIAAGTATGDPCAANQ